MPAANAPGLASLDGIARSVRRAQEAASYASVMIPGGQVDQEKARDFAIRAKDHCAAALGELEIIGARIPGIETDEPDPALASTVPLHLLNTPAVRQFLDLLEVATEAGAAVDRERGWIDGAGESCGWGEQLAGMAMLLRAEAFGPTGRD